MSGGLILVTGAVRSGKSRLAERLAKDNGERVTYVATAEALDEEMRDRIRAHRERRPAGWVTVEEPTDVAEAILKHGSTSDAVIVDCMGVFVTNILVRQPPEMPYEERCEEVLERIRRMVGAAGQVPARVIVVSNEVGWGLVPDNVLGRIFRDAMGWANQIVAEVASHVFLTVAGIPLDLKALNAARSQGEEDAL